MRDIILETLDENKAEDIEKIIDEEKITKNRNEEVTEQGKRTHEILNKIKWLKETDKTGKIKCINSKYDIVTTYYSNNK